MVGKSLNREVQVDIGKQIRTIEVQPEPQKAPQQVPVEPKPQLEPVEK